MDGWGGHVGEGGVRRWIDGEVMWGRGGGGV
jgi:hypothetical protein